MQELQFYDRYQLFDKWSFAHFAVSFPFGYYGIDFPTFLAVTLGWKLIEPSQAVHDIESRIGIPTWTPEQQQSTVADIIVNIVGWAAGKYIKTGKW